MRGTGLFVIALIILGNSPACGGRGPSSTTVSSTAETIAGCFIPALGQCTAARYLLECHSDAGVNEVCISDEATQCPNCTNLPCGYVQGVGSSGCSDQCGTDEYVVMCGMNAAPGTTPPAACRSAGGDPGGQAFYCCPCGS